MSYRGLPAPFLAIPQGFFSFTCTQFIYGYFMNILSLPHAIIWHSPSFLEEQTPDRKVNGKLVLTGDRQRPQYMKN